MSNKILEEKLLVEQKRLARNLYMREWHKKKREADPNYKPRYLTGLKHSSKKPVKEPKESKTAFKIRFDKWVEERRNYHNNYDKLRASKDEVYLK